MAARRVGIPTCAMAGLLVVGGALALIGAGVGARPAGAAASEANLGYTPLASPVRIADTRPGAADPSTYAGRTLGPGASLTIDIPSSAGVPPNAGAVVANLTAIAPAASGFVSAYPAGDPNPGTSNIDFVAGQTVANMVTVGVGIDSTDGSPALTIFDGPAAGGGAVNIALDLLGYYAPQGSGSGEAYVALTPARIFDSRPGSGKPGAGRTLTGGGSVNVPVTGIGGVPSDASAVVLNVGITDATAASFVETYPTGSPPSPPTSTENWTPGETLSAKSVVAVGSGGDVTVQNHAGDVDVVVDVDGYYTAPGVAGALFNALPSPARILDTRTGSSLAGGASITSTVAGANGVPASATAGVLNVTDIGPATGNFLTVYPKGSSVPLAADVNYAKGDTYNTVANASYSKIGSTQIAIYNGPTDAGRANVVVDLFGYFAPSDSPSPLAVTTTALPGALEGVSYSTTLAATGGTPPYGWSLSSGSLPSGLSLAADGVISGIPSTSGTSNFTVQVADSTAPLPLVASASLQISVALQPQPTQSQNWSGYTVTSGPYTSVTGTFTVPSLLAGDPSSSALGVWAGIDGWNDIDLIQAGIGEFPISSDQFELYAWWEILPATETVISPTVLAPNPGDEMTVSIAQLSATDWNITVADDTTGQSFSTNQIYTGPRGGGCSPECPASSAEWIVEAPSSANNTVAPLSAFAPSVSFSNLGYTGSATTLYEISMVQGGSQVATPSALSSAGFTVAYGSTAGSEVPAQSAAKAGVPGHAVHTATPPPVKY